MKLSSEDIANCSVVLALEFAWNGIAAHLNTSQQIQEAIQTLNPVVNTALLMWVVCYVIYRARTAKRQSQWDLEHEALQKRVSELEERLHKYDDADSRVKVSVDVDDYLQVTQGR